MKVPETYQEKLQSLANKIGNNFRIIYTDDNPGYQVVDLSQIPKIKPDYENHYTDLKTALADLQQITDTKANQNINLALQAKLPKNYYTLQITANDETTIANEIKAIKQLLPDTFIQTRKVGILGNVQITAVGNGRLKKTIGKVSAVNTSDASWLVLGNKIIASGFNSDKDTADFAQAFAEACNKDPDFTEHINQITQKVIDKTNKKLKTKINDADLDDDYFDKLGIGMDALNLNGVKANDAYENKYKIRSQAYLNRLLYHIGSLWIEKHTNPKTGRVTPMDQQHIKAYIIKFDPTCCVNVGEELMFYFYDWDTKTYSNNAGKLKEMINALTHDNVGKRVIMDICTTIAEFQTVALPVRIPMEDIPQRNTKTGKIMDIVYAKNGLYDYNKKKFTQYSPNILCLRQAQTDLNLNLTMKDQPHLGMIDPVTGKKLKQGWWYPLKLIEDLSRVDNDDAKIDKQVYHALLQTCRCAVTGNGKTQQCVLLYEENGASGKSTLIRLLENIVGNGKPGISKVDNCASLSMSDMNDPNKLAGAANAMLIASNENDFRHATRKSLDRFKQAVTEDSMPMKMLYRDQYEGHLTGMILMASNQDPELGQAQKDGGYYRRIVAIPIRHQLMRPDDPKAKAGTEFTRVINEFINDQKVREWFYWFLITQVPPCDHIDEPDVSKNAKKQMQLDDDAINSFVEDWVKQLKSKFITNDFLYQSYLNYAHYTNAGLNEEHIGMRIFLKRLRNNNWMQKHFKTTTAKLKGKWNANDGQVFDELASKIAMGAHHFAKKDDSNNSAKGNDPYRSYGNSTKAQRGFARIK